MNWQPKNLDDIWRSILHGVADVLPGVVQAPILHNKTVTMAVR